MRNPMQYLGIAELKVEGQPTNFDPSYVSTPKNDAERARLAKEYDAYLDVMRSIPDVLTPEWLRVAVDLSTQQNPRNGITYLRRLLLFRMATKAVIMADECAKIVMGGEEDEAFDTYAGS